MTHSHHPGVSVQTVVSPTLHGLSASTCPPEHDALRVLDIAARDALSVCYRYEGLWVEVLTEHKFYRLIGGLTNDCWVSCGHGGGDGDISPDDLPIASKTEQGIVQIGDNISVDAEGLIAVPVASDDTAGVVELASAEEVKVGANLAKVVTSATLAAAFISKKSTTGYLKLPGGIIFQWGVVMATPQGVEVTLPTSYTSAHFVATATDTGQSDNWSNTFGRTACANYGLTTFTVSGDGHVRYISVGC